MTPRQERIAWAAAVVLGVLLPFAPAVLGFRTLSFGDTDRLYSPVRTLVVEALRDGRLPLWNPYEGTGKPLFAEGIHSVLHPISLLAAVVDPSSIDFLILAYLVAAALGAFLLARTLDASPPASAGAGLAYALSGFSVSMTGNLVFLAGLSTLPWLLAAARSAGRGDRWGIVLTALASASAFFSGDVQVAIVGLALGLLLAADAGGPRGAARAVAGFLPGILLAAVQILATYELLPLSYRSLSGTEALPAWEKAQWSLTPGRLLEWVLPGLFRGPLGQLPRDTEGRILPTVFANSVFLGAPLLFAACVGAFPGRSSASRRSALLLAGAGIVLLWIALGYHLEARRLLDWIPVWNQFRYSEKLMAPLALCLAALAALGIDRFGAGPLPRPWRMTIFATLVALGLLLVAVRFAPDAASRLASGFLHDAGPFFLSTFGRGLPHLLGALALLVVVDRLPTWPARASALAALVALAPASAVYAGTHLGSRALRAFMPPLRLTSDSPTPRIAQPADYVVDMAEDHLEATARHGALLFLPATNVARRVDTIEPFGAFAPRRLTALASSLGAGWGLAFRRYGLTHLALPVPLDPGSREAALLATDGGVTIQRDDTLGIELWAVPHRPWAFFAARALPTVPTAPKLTPLLDLIERGDDTTVIVEWAGPIPTEPGRVLRSDRARESLRIEAETHAPALLVVQDAFWPGWRAFIDGQPAEILAADSLVRAVRWPAGRHELEMIYDPPEIRAGLALSAVGALLLLILAGHAASRQPRQPADGASPARPQGFERQ